MLLQKGLGLLKESSRIAGSAAQVLNYRSTLAIIALDCFFALVGILLMFRSRISRKKFFADGFNTFWVVLVVFLGILAVVLQYGPHEGYQRALMFGLVPLSYLCVLALRKRPKILVIVLVALIFLNIPAQYGADSYTLQTKTDLSGAQFIATKTPNGIVCLYDFSLLARYFDPAKNINFKILETLPFTYVPNASNVLDVASQCDYVILSNTSDNYYYYFMRQTPISDVFNSINTSLVGFDRVYDSKDFIVLGKK
ncbi:MAG TPA: hypothetical protein VK253_04575 [Candidatus Binatia bacterium]|nr:hypothetical protein [Candidatus Binatia bacterium]